jgi:ureidoglycolate hydrolase
MVGFVVVVAAVGQNPVISSPAAFPSGNTTAVLYSKKTNVERIKKNKELFLHIAL